MKPRGGFSLLEVILAMAILFGAIAVLGELGRLGLHNAQITRDLARAELLCESKLAELTAGAAPLAPVHRAPFEEEAGDGEQRWLYSIATEPLDEDGLTAVRVTVVQDLPQERRPVECSLTRWILIDEETETFSQTDEEEESGAGASDS